MSGVGKWAVILYGLPTYLLADCLTLNVVSPTGYNRKVAGYVLDSWRRPSAGSGGRNYDSTTHKPIVAW